MTKKELLGSFAESKAELWEPFATIEKVLKQFQESSFKKLSNRKKFKQVNRILLELISQAATPCFLFPAILDYINRVDTLKLLHEPYNFHSFEFWLNRFSHISEEENLAVRSKIVGKSIPREEYQAFFPIGTGKTFPGTHFVAAHASPDIDTTISSFWGFMDSFGAKVSEGAHLWSLPGTFPESHFTQLFKQLFSPSVFQHVARTTPTLTLTARDLVTQKEMLRVHEHTLSSTLDHTHVNKAIVLVDDEEHYKGDWRSSDTDAVRHVVILFTTAIRWFENSIHSHLIAIFAKKTIHLSDIQKALDPIFESPLTSIDPVKEYSDIHKQLLNDYLQKVLHVKKGIKSTFHELWQELDHISDNTFAIFFKTLQSLSDKKLFDASQKLIEDRPQIFSLLEKIITELRDLISTLRNSIDRLSFMVQVKEKVLQYIPQFVFLDSDVEEIRTKMNSFEHLTVVIPEGDGKWFAVGVIHANDVRRSILGTCSLRDFSNEQETQMAPYLEVISVVDHHKTNLKTSQPPCFIIADAQSSNTLVAECSLGINNRYSHLGISEKTLDQEIAVLSKNLKDGDALKRLATLLLLKRNCQSKTHFVHPKREFAEYYSCLYAILDDTDLLSKVTARDVTIVAALLNRMKSIALAEQVEVVSFADIPKDLQFAKKAALHLLRNEEMYSIYKKIYEYKEMEMEAQLQNCLQGTSSSIFSDTKEQNGCCRVGQTKIFSSNYPLFSKHAEEFRKLWFKEAQKINAAKPQLDFFLHQISTITSHDEVYSGNTGNWKHQDEMWIWVPSTQLGLERLASFLNAILPTPSIQSNKVSCEVSGPNAAQMKEIVEKNFPKAEMKSGAHSHVPLVILRFHAGSLNSRKAQISPYLPRL